MIAPKFDKIAGELRKSGYRPGRWREAERR